MKYSLSVIAIISSMLLLACAKEDPVPPADLHNLWFLQAVRGETIDSAMMKKNPHININASLDGITGYGGCSRMMTGIQVDSNRMSVEKIKTTKDRCPFYQEEIRWFKLLEKTDFYRIEGNELFLIDGQEDVLHFHTRADAPAESE